MQFEEGQMIKSMALVALVDNYLEASIQPQPPEYSALTTDRLYKDKKKMTKIKINKKTIMIEIN